MRQLARVVSVTTLIIGCLAGGGIVLTTCSNTSGSYGDPINWMSIAVGLGVFLSSAATACVLSLLASIDERMGRAGWATEDEQAEKEAAERAANQSQETSDAPSPDDRPAPGLKLRDDSESVL